MRLIDADKLKASYIVTSTTTNSLSHLYVSLEDINSAPTIEAEPVRHGRWIDTGSGQECSICCEIQYGYDSQRHYCANCGAKMNGGDNE